jgi:predicted DNA-binding transcriptional regulator AlpA
MRQDQFRRHLATSSACSTEPSRSSNAEIFIPYADLASHGIRYTRVHLRRLIARGQFPQAVLLSANRCAWRLSDIAHWKQSRPMAPVPPEAA